jgi:hypothetical protein
MNRLKMLALGVTAPLPRHLIDTLAALVRRQCGGLSQLWNRLVDRLFGFAFGNFHNGTVSC